MGGLSGSCAVIVADFAWFSQACGQVAVTTALDEFGTAWPVCAEHAQPPPP